MKTLGWDDLMVIGKYGKHKAWHPDDRVQEYFSDIRTPSRTWPHSYARAAQTYKFAYWLLDNRPDIAKHFKLDVVGDE